MLEWQCRQKHREDLMAAHRETGHVSDLGVVWKFNGEKFWRHFGGNGHSSGEFRRCKCKEAIDG